MLPESDNIVWGTCKNPHDYKRSPGGSSGGEGALIGANCSPIGIGTDIGGSIRIPSAFCGVYGFKPSTIRTTYRGTEPVCKKYNVSPFHCIMSACGPIARCMDDIIAITKILMSKDIYDEDAHLCPMEFDEAIVNEYVDKKNLRIGYLKYEGNFYPSAPVIDAMNKTIQACKDAGHELIELDPSKFQKFIYPYAKVLLCNNGIKDDCLNGEPLAEQYELSPLPGLLPRDVKHYLAKVLGLVGMKREALMLENIDNADLLSYIEGTLEKQLCVEEHMWYWKELNLDCMVMPAQSLPAMKLGHSKELVVS